MKRKLVSSLLAFTLILGLTSCKMPQKHVETTPSDLPTHTTYADEIVESQEPEETLPDYPCVNPAFDGLSAEEICSMLSLEDKAAQMVQGACYLMDKEDMQDKCYGSVLSYDQSLWPSFTLEQWQERVRGFQEAALLSQTRIPYIYGNDFLHGINSASGTVIFPHNINLGAADDEALTFEMGVLTGSDMVHSGMLWNFSPCVAAAQDPRWGRTYESYSNDESVVRRLAVAYSNGLLSQGVVVCGKHFLGDGYTKYGTGEDSDVDRLIDRGDAQMSEEQIKESLDTYKALIDAGVQSIMLSHSSVNGVKMHENGELIRKLKEEYGFEGVILSDWDSLHNCSGESFKDNVILCVNAGIDMFMEAEQFEATRQYIIEGVEEGSISSERIDDAVTRILRMKINCGLFNDPFGEEREPSYEWNSKHEHEVARELAAKSMVPLKLPESGPMKLEEGKKVFVMGPAANDSGALCGGWTYIWQGLSDAENDGEHWCKEGPTILEALQANQAEGGYEIITDKERIDECDMILLCVGEIPYAEWVGDTEDLKIDGELGLDGNKAAIEWARDSGKPTLTLIVAGRNVIIDEYVENWNEVIMCYLPGSEGGNAVVDILTGAVEFNGRLPMPYYSSVSQIGSEEGECWLPAGYSAAVKNSTENATDGSDASETSETESNQD
ncbi:MAG: glycoside hydrolase family 3 protein [Clostridiales bacterium]|nr:glycoside hydrolase family 3 protein [Clostridiales bacterium]